MTCPKCHKELSSNTFCNGCKITICPKCGHSQEYDSSVSWSRAILYFLLMPFMLIAMLFAENTAPGMSEFFLPETAVCKGCGVKYSIARDVK